MELISVFELLHKQRYYISSLILYRTINVENELSNWTIEDALAFVGCDEAITA